MIYGYLRVSTDKQTRQNQQYAIEEFCKKNNMAVDRWIEETVSGSKKIKARKLGHLIDMAHTGDIILCTEISRIGRSLLMVMSALNECMERGIQVWTVRDNYRFGDDISSKVFAFAFGLAAEIEKNLISQRTKEALDRKREEGVVLGRAKGQLSQTVKLSGKEKQIKKMIENGLSYRTIARLTEVHRHTVSQFVKRMERAAAMRVRKAPRN